MALYTVIADYDGGTYISQVRADNVNQAVIVWAEQLEVEDIPNLGPTSKAKLINELRQEQKEGFGPTLLNGLMNAWCDSSMICGKLMLINIIQTDAT